MCLFGVQMYASVAKTSPFLVDQYQDYFLGGVNDMAGWTTRLWNQTIVMLENGTRFVFTKHYKMFAKVSRYLWCSSLVSMEISS